MDNNYNYYETLEDYDIYRENKMLEEDEAKLEELLKKYEIIDLGSEHKDRFLGERNNLRNFLIEAEKLQLI